MRKFVIQPKKKKNIHAQCWAQWCIPQVNQNNFSLQNFRLFFFFFNFYFYQNIQSQCRYSFRKLHATLHNFKWNEMNRSVENDITRGQRPMILFVLHTVHVSLLACSPVFSTNMNINGRCFFFLFNPRLTTNNFHQTWKLSAADFSVENLYRPAHEIQLKNVKPELKRWKRKNNTHRRNLSTNC